MKLDKKTQDAVRDKVSDIGITKVSKATGLAYNTIISVCEKGVCTSSTFTKLATFLNEEQKRIDKLIQELEA